MPIWNMLRALAAPALLLALPSTTFAAPAPISGTDESHCAAGHSAVLVVVRGFKSNVGRVRAQLYGPGPESFLQKGAYLIRAERVRDGKAEMRFCLPAPRPGTYAVAVRHDANGSGSSDWNDGGGFSRDPRLSVLAIKPSFDKVAIDIGKEPREIVVTMQYRSGLSIKPIQ